MVVLHVDFCLFRAVSMGILKESTKGNLCKRREP